jgi:hypothetical protein
MALTLQAQNSKKSNSELTIRLADSLFTASAWKNAVPVYEGVLTLSVFMCRGAHVFMCERPLHQHLNT